jgi:hypothetical protein
MQNLPLAHPKVHRKMRGKTAPPNRINQPRFPTLRYTWLAAYKYRGERTKNTCVARKTTPLLTVRELAQFPNTM